MSFAFIVYFISVIGNVGGLLVFATIFLLFYNMFNSWLVYDFNHDNDYEIQNGYKEKKSYIKWPFITAVVFAVIAALIPSKNDAYLIAGAYAAEKVYDSDIGQDTLKLIHAKIKQQLEEMQQPKK